jgi:hypothetical protein
MLFLQARLLTTTFQARQVQAMLCSTFKSLDLFKAKARLVQAPAAGLEGPPKARVQAAESEALLYSKLKPQAAGFDLI